MTIPTAYPASKPADRMSIPRAKCTLEGNKIGASLCDERKNKLTVVLGPPGEMTPADDIIKEETDEHPGYVVERCRGGQGARRPKNKRKIEVLEQIHSQLLVQHPLY